MNQATPVSEAPTYAVGFAHTLTAGQSIVVSGLLNGDLRKQIVISSDNTTVATVADIRVFAPPHPNPPQGVTANTLASAIAFGQTNFTLFTSSDLTIRNIGVTSIAINVLETFYLRDE